MSDVARLMDRIYVHQRHIYDATRKYYLLGRDELIASLNPPEGARILEIGCGTGRNLIQIARRYPRVQCFGIDISQAMLSTANASVLRASLEKRIRLAAGNATNFDPQALFAVKDFDRIVISYALSMIPPWRDVLRRGADVLAPAGCLHVVDFGDQADLPKAFKTMLGAWLARFHVTPREALAEEIAALAREHGLVARSRTLFRGYAIRAELARQESWVSL